MKKKQQGREVLNTTHLIINSNVYRERCSSLSLLWMMICSSDSPATVGEFGTTLSRLQWVQLMSENNKSQQLLGVHATVISAGSHLNMRHMWRCSNTSLFCPCFHGWTRLWSSCGPHLQHRPPAPYMSLGYSSPAASSRERGGAWVVMSPAYRPPREADREHADIRYYHILYSGEKCRATGCACFCSSPALTHLTQERVVWRLSNLTMLIYSTAAYQAIYQ